MTISLRDDDNSFIPNPVVYTVPSDSESSDEEEEFSLCITQKYQYPTRPIYSPNTEIHEAIGNVVDTYNERLNNQQNNILTTVNNNTYFQRYTQHQEYIIKQRQHYLSEYERKVKENTGTVQKLFEQLNLNLKNKEKELDQQFQDDIKKHEKLIQDAIAYDLKKQQDKEKEKQEQDKLRKAKDEADKKRLEESKKAEEERKAKQLLEAKKMNSNKGAASTAGLEEYKKHMATIENYKMNIRPRLQEDAFRKQCFEARRVIKRTIIQIQYKEQVILEKYKTLYNHLLNIKSQSNDAFHVMLNHLAKTLMLQVRQEVDGSPFAAYFLARLAVLLSGSIPEFKEYLHGRLLKRCPYLVPNYFDDDVNLSQDQIKKLLHYQYDAEKKEYQTFLQYAPKQRCYVMFFAGMIIFSPGNGYPANPYPIGLGWTWCARILNMQQREITPLLVHSFLEIAGNQMLRTYPRQFPKILRLLYDKILPTAPIHPTKDNISHITALKLYLEDYFKTGNLVPIPDVVKSTV